MRGVSVAERFRDGCTANIVCSRQISNRAGNAQRSMPGASRESESVRGVAQQCEGVGTEVTVGGEPTWRDRGVEGTESFELSRPRLSDASTQRCGFRFARGRVEVGERHGADGHVQVDAIGERTRHAATVSREGAFVASAGDRGVSGVAAGAGVHRDDEEHVRRKADAAGDACDGDDVPLSGSLCVAGHISLCA